MKHAWLRKFLGERLFYRIFLFYSIIIFTALLVLTGFVTNSVTQTIRQQELDENMQILASLSDYVEDKYESSRVMLQQLYTNSEAAADLTYFLRNDFDAYMSHRLDLYSRISSETMANFQTYVNSYFLRDGNIDSVVLYSDRMNFYYVFGAEQGPHQEKFSDRIRDNAGMATGSSRSSMPQLFLSREMALYGQRVFSTVSGITDSVSLEGIGAMIVNYRMDGIRSILSKHREKLTGSILVLTNEGDVLFDSTDRYNEAKYPYADLLDETKKNVMLDEESYVNVLHSAGSGVVVAGIIPAREIKERSSGIRNTLYTISALLIALSLLLTYTVIHAFSRRTGVLMKGIASLQSGDLSTRIPVGQNKDELSLIACQFNQMCDSLQSYISRVYVSEIKQKNAELLALQSQINPHFLYNTLEVIRMKAVSRGAGDVGDMVYILATLFRNTVKGETFIPISEELDHCRLYLELFRIRYEGRLQFRIDVAAEALRYCIAKFILQPVVENSILHGFQQDSDENFILVSGRIEGGDLILEVTDNGAGITVERLGTLRETLAGEGHDPKRSIGLPNVNERLRILYGADYGLDVSSGEGKGTTVRIRIPARRKEDMPDVVQGVSCG